MNWLLALIIFLPVSVFAQIVTASFDRTQLSKNPAAATNRWYSQTTVFNSFRNVDSKITQEGIDRVWDERIKINKTGIFFTGHGKWAPELYVSMDKAEKTLKTKEGTAEGITNRTDLINNLINLGFRVKQKWSLGLTFFSPSYDFKDSYKTKFSGTTFKQEETQKAKITGIGSGFTYLLTPKLIVGGYFIRMQESRKFGYERTDGARKEKDSGNASLGHNQFGLGISNVRGTKSRGIRYELAYSLMTHDTGDDNVINSSGEEIFLSGEYGGKRFFFGGNVKLRKNSFYDSLELIDYVIGDKTASSTYSPSYGGFFALRLGSGHTFGISGLMYQTSGEKLLFGLEEKADSTVMQFSGNYAYIY